MFKQVLVPLDGSPLAEAVLPHATVIAKSYGGQLALLSVIDPGGLEVRQEHQRSVSAIVDRTSEWFRRYLEQVAARRQREGVAVTHEVVIGPVAENIISYAEKSKTDLVAMSTHGRSGAQRWMLGSVTDKVLHTGQTPLLIVRPAETSGPPAQFKTVIVPLDGSPLGETALSHARDLARQMKLRVALVQVVSPGLGTYGEAEALSAYPNELLTALENDASKYLAGVAERVRADGTECDTKVLVGSTSGALQSFAQGEPASLIAMSTHGRSGVTRALLGSVTDHMVRGSGDAVLVTRPAP